MNRLLQPLCLLLGLLLGPTAAVQAQVPLTFSYQGVLLDADGSVATNGTYTLHVTLYDAAADGTALWTETQTDVLVETGVFSVLLGSTTPLELPFDRPYWMGIAVGDEAELVPRLPLAAAPYSLGTRAVVNEPAAGESFAVRAADGSTAHVLSPDGTVIHAGRGTFEDGLLVPGDTSTVPIEDPDGTESEHLSKTTQAGNAAVPTTGVDVFGTAIGVKGSSTTGRGVLGKSDSFVGVQGQSVSNVGVFGFSQTSAGVEGRSPSSVGVFGSSDGQDGVQGRSVTGSGVRGISDSGAGLFGQGALGGHFLNQVRLDEVTNDPTNQRVLVWGSDNIVKWRTLPDGGGGDSAWLVDSDGNLVAEGRGVVVKNSEGEITTRFDADGTSLHTGHETFTGGLTITDDENKPGILIDRQFIATFTESGDFAVTLGPDTSTFSQTVIISDDEGRDQIVLGPDGLKILNPATGAVTTEFKPDGTSLHTGDETFEGDVILKGEGIKLVDEAGTTLAGFGRTDLDTGQRLGVFSRAIGENGLAGAFEGDVELDGDLRIYDANGNLTTEFKEDGTSLHKGLETFEGGLRVPLANGNSIWLMPNDGYSIKTAEGEFIAHNDPNGNAFFAGNVAKGGGSFQIDHPLDPENKYLYHSFVESPDMMNVYNGTIVLDAAGEAVVELPAWFEALNRDFRYQLTPIGGPGPNLHIAERIQGNRFTIAGGTPNLEVSWQVTGVRQDPYAEQHRIPVEVEKGPGERGHYLHPAAYGQPETKRIVRPLPPDAALSRTANR